MAGKVGIATFILASASALTLIILGADGRFKKNSSSNSTNTTLLGGDAGCPQSGCNATYPNSYCRGNDQCAGGTEPIPSSNCCCFSGFQWDASAGKCTGGSSSFAYQRCGSSQAIADQYCLTSCTADSDCAAGASCHGTNVACSETDPLEQMLAEGLGRVFVSGEKCDTNATSAYGAIQTGHHTAASSGPFCDALTADLNSVPSSVVVEPYNMRIDYNTSTYAVAFKCGFNNCQDFSGTSAGPEGDDAICLPLLAGALPGQGSQCSTYGYISINAATYVGEYGCCCPKETGDSLPLSNPYRNKCNHLP